MKAINLPEKQGGLSPRQFREMREMLTQLTPAERATLLDPDFIAEDEADLIVSGRRMSEPSASLADVLANDGYGRRLDR